MFSKSFFFSNQEKKDVVESELAKMDYFNSLPNELIEMCSSYLSIKDAKSFSLTSKRMHSLTLSKIWKCPRFEKKMPLDTFKILSLKLPIEELHTCDLDVNFKDKETWRIFSRLKRLHIDHYDELLMSDLLKVSFTGINLHIHTKSLKLNNQKDFKQLLNFAKHCKVESLAVNHSYDWYLDKEDREQRPWSLELRLICKNFYISEILSSLWTLIQPILLNLSIYFLRWKNLTLLWTLTLTNGTENGICFQ